MSEDETARVRAETDSEYEAMQDQPAHGQTWLDRKTGLAVGILAVRVRPQRTIVSGHWHRQLDVEQFIFPLNEFLDRFILLGVEPDDRDDDLTDQAEEKVEGAEARRTRTDVELVEVERLVALWKRRAQGADRGEARVLAELAEVKEAWCWDSREKNVAHAEVLAFATKRRKEVEAIVKRLEIERERAGRGEGEFKTYIEKAEKPWADEVERRWEALRGVEHALVERANDAVAVSASTTDKLRKQGLQTRSVALVESAGLLRDAMRRGEQP